ncbi:MAG TPA: efflux transporter outer membrane subunit [Deltaproteobacteria bacterium]|nr:efflux transporter outer membrane subunit [Deltaproteobacteria bacterium]
MRIFSGARITAPGIFLRSAGKPGMARRALAGAAVALACLGCAAVGPDYVRPRDTAPQAWSTALDKGLRDQPVDAQELARWWRSLNDPLLEGLITKAVQGNLDRKEALARLRQARAQHTVAAAGLFPTLSAGGSGTKSKQGGASDVSTSYRAALDAGWEIDLFGGQRRSAQAAEAEVQAAQEDVNAVMVSLCAEVALNYIELRTTQTRIASTRANIAIQEQTYNLEQARHAAGLSDALAVRQALANLETTRAQIPSLNASLEASMNALAVLLGQPPGTLSKALAVELPIPEVPRQLLVGVPADAVRNRPDVRKAERELAAQTARVGVATAELYPKITLTGDLGTMALSSGDLFSAGTRFFSYGPTISVPVFKAGSLRSAVKVQSALQEQALCRYEASVLTALEEAENAVSAYVKELSRRDTLARAVTAAQEAQSLAQYKYVAGLTSFDTVLDAQRTLTGLQDSLAQSTGDVAGNLVRLYKALGGGWDASLQAGEGQNPSRSANHEND